ncbi:Olfactory Receptor 11L1 [Manis pentadactyla]|nr:Olfactory Receptor 11L1 [Manis pentadactyla]
MGPQNVSTVTEFQLLGFQSLPERQTLLFAIFLFIYFLTVTGNVVIIAVVIQDQRLRLPMYTFLQHLSFLEKSSLHLSKILFLFSRVTPVLKPFILSLHECMKDALKDTLAKGPTFPKEIRSK